MLRRWWERITEPRFLSVIYGGVYTIGMLTGVATLLVPPTTISGQLGVPLTFAWSLFFIVGGVIGMVVVLPGWWAWERWACVFSLTAIGIYGFVISTLHFTAAGSRLTQIGVLALAAAVFAIRLVLIKGRSYGPRAL